MMCPRCGYGTLKGYDFLCNPCKKKAYKAAMSDYQLLPPRPKLRVKSVELPYGKDRQ